VNAINFCFVPRFAFGRTRSRSRAPKYHTAKLVIHCSKRRALSVLVLITVNPFKVWVFNIERRHLRRTYGPGFAKNCADDAKLSDVLHKLDELSLSHLISDHQAGYLHQICRAA
jgi:hypothetical protein